MVRSAGGKRVTGRDMTKSLVKSHVDAQTGRHATPLQVANAPKVAQARPRRVRKAAKVLPKL
ncbi:MAG TPA: hypothetical protein VLW55_02800 [Burkholderiaceae bacterium]|nr:hypothetical protein [Burkholderiaceae bacterium]